MGKLKGWKRILGIVGWTGTRVLELTGVIQPGTADIIETISIGVLGYGVVDAHKRKDAAGK